MEKMKRRNKSDVGARFRAARKMAGLNQDQLARTIGVDQSTVSNLERGKIPPMVEKFTDAALAVNETPDSLLLVRAGTKAERLSDSRKGAPEESIDALVDTTLALIQLDRAALRQGEKRDNLPSRIFADHVEQVTKLVAAQRSWPRAGNAPDTHKSSTPPLSQAEADLLIQYLGDEIDKSRWELPLVVAFERLTTWLSLQGDPHKASAHAAEDAASAPTDDKDESGDAPGAKPTAPAAAKRTRSSSP
jgi:transcriptional regulator with XRE-family HTH domain